MDNIANTVEYIKHSMLNNTVYLSLSVYPISLFNSPLPFPLSPSLSVSPQFKSIQDALLVWSFAKVLVQTTLPVQLNLD